MRVASLDKALRGRRDAVSHLQDSRGRDWRIRARFARQMWHEFVWTDPDEVARYDALRQALEAGGVWMDKAVKVVLGVIRMVPQERRIELGYGMFSTGRAT